MTPLEQAAKNAAEEVAVLVDESYSIFLKCHPNPECAKQHLAPELLPIILRHLAPIKDEGENHRADGWNEEQRSIWLARDVEKEPKLFRDAIDKTHPMEDGAGEREFKADSLAMELVGERRSKRDLVDLVRWLLCRSDLPLPEPPQEGGVE
jgi:hypothetical protein